MGPKLLHSHKFPGDANTAGPWTTRVNQLLLLLRHVSSIINLLLGF